MFDVVSSNDGSGILFESRNGEEEISMEVEVGDTVELSFSDEEVYVEVTEKYGRKFEGEIISFSSGFCPVDLSEGDIVEFKSSNILRCIHE